jgi:hypothetical protein
MRNTSKGKFTPKNPQKYIGTNINKIIYRSSWELSLMQACDTHPYILQWASEAIKIPYKHPITGKYTMYVPDFLIVYADKKLVQHCEMIEVKPEKEVFASGYIPKTQNEKIVQAINFAKFAAATLFCKKRGWHFRVMTERNLFAYSKKM